MADLMDLFLFLLVSGLAAVASNPSPYFAALALVLVAAMACALLASYGGCFLSLLLFLVYLGGMLIVFAFATALAAESYPQGWGSGVVMSIMFFYMLAAFGCYLSFVEGWEGAYWVSADECAEFSMFRGDMAGVALMYSVGGGLLVLGAWVLLLTLFVVLELTRGLSRGALRAV